MIKKLVISIFAIFILKSAVAVENRASENTLDDAIALRSKILPTFSPAIRQWIDEIAGKLSEDKLKQYDLDGAIQKRFEGQSLRSEVRNSIEFLIIVKATQTMNAHIQNKKKELDSIEKQKSEIITSKSSSDKMKGRLNNLNDMSNMTSLRLQMTMDRRSKFIETLFNIMKKQNMIIDGGSQNVK